MFPIGTDCPQRRVPWMNYGIIAANVVIYFLSHGRDGARGFQLQPDNAHLFQFISYQFLHQNLMHILTNMIFLYVFGNNLNEKLGNIGYLAFYLTGGVLAGCGQFVFDSQPTLGASGAVSAVSGMFLVLLPRTNIRVLFVVFLFAEFEIPSMYLILFQLFQDAILQALGGGHVAHAAHITGTLSGVIIGLFLLFTGLIPRDAYDMLAMLTRWKRRREYQAIVAGGYNPFGPSKKLEASGETVAELPAAGAALRQDILNLLGERKFSEAAAQYLELVKDEPHSILPEQAQLDVANQLLSEGKAADAVGAYEDFLTTYRSAQRAQVELLLGLTYARDVFEPERAIELLRRALESIIDPAQRALATQELLRLDPNGPPPSAPPVV